ncbi:hypothetical protein BCR32DRAFT_282348 [Anaeromyces robustus]|uniref:Uncharacterized protein n=1 Tax=Anaeromyces robustus TaxID=1754192 RepID=A0A1Y1WZ42_9FUNG|nr:hypothetical protein BCR32DRAFT_282348 [Anaeromyces robustus]|eukprot:ORX78364.1 hypothetical protein BCR32DRAFT_282348 [Anaeromyces robustus]
MIYTVYAGNTSYNKNSRTTAHITKKLSDSICEGFCCCNSNDVCSDNDNHYNICFSCQSQFDYCFDKKYILTTTIIKKFFTKKISTN